MRADATKADLAVVDTDVFSYIQKRRSSAAPYEQYLRGKGAALSFQTVAEVLQGVYQRPEWSRQAVDDVMAEVRKYLIVPFNMGMVEHWARFRADRALHGLHLEPRDAWIAATAMWLGHVRQRGVSRPSRHPA